MTETYLTAQEVSDRLQGAISVKTLGNWRSSGGGRGPPFCRFGNKILYPATSFETWARNLVFRSTAEYRTKAPPPERSRSPLPSPSQVEDEIEAFWARSLPSTEGEKPVPQATLPRKRKPRA